VFSLYDDGTDIHAHDTASDFSAVDRVPPPRDRWVCYELHVAIAAAGGVELFRDGQRILGEQGLDTRAVTGRVLLGAASKPTAMSQRLFVDDVVIGVARPGCE
jgi:hypothetical protein